MCGIMRILGPTVRTLDTRTVKLPPKQLDPVYNTPEFKAWARQVVARAGHRCEAVDQHGHRCSRAAPEHRIYADHVRELRDGGSLLDLANGQALCRSHHEFKTIAARTRRLMR
jgi:5-methylcytosine-specific restriction enzyme A